MILFSKLICTAMLLTFTGVAQAADSTPSADHLRIAAASDLKFALDEAKAEFVKTHPKAEIEIVTGSSGTFTQQIEAGAPFDLFLSADASYPKELQDRSLIVGTPFSYGRGRLVLWTKNKSGISISQGLITVKSPTVRTIAIANPAHAPYGRAAKNLLLKMKLYDVVEKRLVTADSISQAAQFAQTGAADVGLIALALAMSPEMKSSGTYVLLKEADVLEQSGVILKQAKDKPSAKDFADFLVSKSGQAILAHYGLETGK